MKPIRYYLFSNPIVYYLRCLIVYYCTELAILYYTTKRYKKDRIAWNETILEMKGSD